MAYKFILDYIGELLMKGKNGTLTDFLWIENSGESQVRNEGNKRDTFPHRVSRAMRVGVRSRFSESRGERTFITIRKKGTKNRGVSGRLVRRANGAIIIPRYNVGCRC